MRAPAVPLRHPRPQCRDDVCRPWGCELRQTCERSMEHHGVVIKVYFIPERTGEYCSDYVRRIERGS